MNFRLCLVSALMVVAAFGCSLEEVADDLNAGEVTRFHLEAEIPLSLKLPADGVPALPVDVEELVRVEMPMDLIQLLREQGRGGAADALEESRDKIVSLELVELLYEVNAPNRTPASLGPVALWISPFEAVDEAIQLGHTVPIPAKTAIAMRALEYADGGLDAAGELMQDLSFTVVAETNFSVPAGVEVPANSLTIQLRLKLSIVTDLLR